ncbi:hypothetical protein [Nocardia sp. CA-119907]|uniref:hypothetical protein n=1 Tax=Nocardia sp. CA-119907 TaxID=3239973 RepID=UPI003D95DC44
MASPRGEVLRGRVPAVVRVAGGLIAVEGAGLVAMAAGSIGSESGIAIQIYWLMALGLVVFLAGVALIVGRKWGLLRVIAIVIQLPLLLAALGLLLAGDLIYGIVIGAVACSVVGLLYAPSAREWLGPPHGRWPG